MIMEEGCMAGVGRGSAVDLTFKNPNKKAEKITKDKEGRKQKEVEDELFRSGWCASGSSWLRSREALQREIFYGRERFREV